MRSCGWSVRGIEIEEGKFTLVLGSSAKVRKPVTGKCAFSFKANRLKLWESLLTPTNQ